MKRWMDGTVAASMILCQKFGTEYTATWGTGMLASCTTVFACTLKTWNETAPSCLCTCLRVCVQCTENNIIIKQDCRRFLCLCRFLPVFSLRLRAQCVFPKTVLTHTHTRYVSAKSCQPALISTAFDLCSRLSQIIRTYRVHVLYIDVDTSPATRFKHRACIWKTKQKDWPRKPDENMNANARHTTSHFWNTWQQTT